MNKNEKCLLKKEETEFVLVRVIRMDNTEMTLSLIMKLFSHQKKVIVKSTIVDHLQSSTIIQATKC